MSRRRSPKKLRIFPDARYKSIIVSKFVNYIMSDGKKYVAESIVHQAITKLGKKFKKDSIELFEGIVESVKPLIEVRARRVGGSTYQIPVEVNSNRQLFKSLKWIIAAAKKRGGGTDMASKLYLEFCDICNKKGGALKKREDTHKMAEANKAFSHFRF
jgi:small subunit ribosomal protein S7